MVIAFVGDALAGIDAEGTFVDVGAWVGCGDGEDVGTGVTVCVGVDVGDGPVIAIVFSCDQVGAPQLPVYLPTLNWYSPGPV